MPRDTREERTQGATWADIDLRPIATNTRWMRDLSYKLDCYWRRDFRPFRDALKKAYPQSWHKMLARLVPMIWRFASENADLYSRPPKRTFRSRTGLSPGQAEALARWYEWLRVDTLFQEAYETLVVQRTVLGVFRPTPTWPGFTVQLFRPWECSVVANPLLPGSLSSALGIRMAVPLQAGPNLVHQGALTLDPGYIYVENGAERIPEWEPDGSNPFGGAYPAFYGRLGPPMKGEFWAAPLEDLAAANDAINMDHTDEALIKKFAGFGQRYIKGADSTALPDEWQFGPEHVVPLMGEADLRVSQPQPTSMQNIAVLEKYVGHVLQFNGLNADRFMNSNAETGVAKQTEYVDRERFKLAHRPSLLEMEGRFARGLVMVLNRGRAASAFTFPTDIEVDVEYFEADWPQEPQNAAQADETLQRIGVESAVEQIARRRKVPLDEARALQVQIRADQDGAGRTSAAPPAGGAL